MQTKLVKIELKRFIKVRYGSGKCELSFSLAKICGRI